MKVGFIGWRGMVGSVLMQRMREENDFAHIPEAHFFTTLHQIRPRTPTRKRLEWLLD